MTEVEQFGPWVDQSKQLAHVKFPAFTIAELANRSAGDESRSSVHSERRTNHNGVVTRVNGHARRGHEKLVGSTADNEAVEWRAEPHG